MDKALADDEAKRTGVPCTRYRHVVAYEGEQQYTGDALRAKCEDLARQVGLPVELLDRSYAVAPPE